jgi:hypothetical protein
VSKPAGNGRNVHAAFDATRREQVSQIVMSDAIRANLCARSIKRLLTFADAEYFRVQRLVMAFAPHSFKQRASIWNQRNTSQLPILRTSFGIAAHNDLACVKVHVSPGDLARLTDTVTLPAGTFVWTTGVTITKAITLQGNTTVDSDAGTAVDNTILVDSDVRRRSGGYPFITVISQAGKPYRITGLTIDGGGATIMNYNGAIILKGNSRLVRVDHMNWRANVTRENNDYLISGCVCGVADHIVIKNPCESYAIYNGDTWPDGTGSNGDQSYAAPDNFGSADFWFVEDNYIDPPQDPGTNPNSGPDDLRGARWVWRHNHLFYTQVQSHGTEDGRWHGGRAREIYNNDFHHPVGKPVFGVGGARSGVVLFHDNTFDGTVVGQSVFTLEAYRTIHKWPASPFGGATGDNPWDVNVTEANGTHVEGHPPFLFASGIATATTDQNTIVDTNAIFANYAGYTAKYTGDNQVAWIRSNTITILTIGPWGSDAGGPHFWVTGDGYQIHKVLITLDQPGRGQGDLITGNPR